MSIPWQRYLVALVITAACTALAALIFPWLDAANLIMVYLLGATVAALRLGRGPAALTAVMNVVAFDFFFVRPRFTLAVADIQYLVTFTVMLIVALTVASLVANLRAQTRAATERELRAAQLAAAAEKEALRNTLLSAISHDLRTPLATIAGASSMLCDPALQLDAPTRARLAATIDGKAREMSALISNVLDLMRFESGVVGLRRDWQTVDDLVGGALGRLAELLGTRPVTVALPADLPAVYVDAPLITQVLCNLLENAVKHTPDGTAIRISASTEERAVRVVVADDGPGLPPGDVQRLFEKFQRGRNEDSSGGAGLGLAICRAIMRAHGSDVIAANNAGGGASFSFTLGIEGPPS